jgi:hypothetical protein
MPIKSIEVIHWAKSGSPGGLLAIVVENCESNDASDARNLECLADSHRYHSFSINDEGRVDCLF